jgi:ficolin
MFREALAIVLFISSCCAVEEILIQQHYDGAPFFDRTWNEFKTGFGSTNGNYWIGNERLHELTSTGKYYLRVEMESQTDSQIYRAEYKTFKVGPGSDGYRLTVGGYSGDAGDSLYTSDQMKFTTKDVDNDKAAKKNCADMRKGGFWYNYCALAELNGIYDDSDDGGFCWYSLPVSGTKRRLNYDRMYLVAFEQPPCEYNPCLNGGPCNIDGEELFCRCSVGDSNGRCLKAVEEILIQQHYHAEQFFDRTWADFKIGFGNNYDNYWVGNERLHQLTSTGKYYLRVVVKSATDQTLYYADYKTFKVGPATDGYRLSIGEYSGNAGDSLYDLDQMKFTTKDRDNDKRSKENCADVTKGGFWYNACTHAPLNGIYKDNTNGGFFWQYLPIEGSKQLNYDRMYLVAFEPEPCQSSPCQNGGTCEAEGENFVCRCAVGFTGDRCQEALKPDPCKSNPCLNGGTCETEGEEFVCRCAVGFAGERCQKDEAECKSTPPEDRINCGWGGVTSGECIQRSCCYDTSCSNCPVCYYQATDCATIDQSHRVDCGFVGISYYQCTGRGCCYDDDPDTNPNGPICFRKGNLRCIGVPASQRIQQGESTIHPNVCLANGWCYDTSAEPNCFSVSS